MCCCEHADKSLGFTKVENFLNQMSDYQLMKKRCTTFGRNKAVE